MTEYIDFAAALVALCVACYLFGEYRGSRHQYEPAPIIQFAHSVEAEVVAVGELEARIEQVAYLESSTSPIDIIRVDVGETTSAHQLFDDKTQLANELVLLGEKFARAERLRARYLRLLRADRARLRHMLGPVMDAPRRPSKPKLLATVIDIGTARQPQRLHVVPPQISHRWKEAAA